MQKGYTLTELIIVCAIASLLMFGSSAPSNISNAIKSYTEPRILIEKIFAARFLAIQGNHHVILCPLSDNSICSRDWNRTLFMFIDENNNKKLDENEQVIDQISPYPISGRKVYYPRTMIRFTPMGMINGYTGTLSYCTDFNHKGIIISRVGRVRFAQDLNGDGIPDKNRNEEVPCR